MVGQGWKGQDVSVDVQVLWDHLRPGKCGLRGWTRIQIPRMLELLEPSAVDLSLLEQINRDRGEVKELRKRMSI